MPAATREQAILLGALLHDIGKFTFRAQPLKAGEDHETLGTYFIREHLGKCKVLEEQIETVIRAANRSVGKIWLADVTTARERQEEASSQTRRPLISILSQVRQGEHSRPAGTHYLLPQPLTLAVQVPQHTAVEVGAWKPDEEAMIAAHRESWEAFLKEVARLRVMEDFEAFFESFYALLEKYTAHISSASYKSVPDISLFDHSRAVAAVAHCLEQQPDASQELLLVKGDLSGIQSFIYQDIREEQNPAKQLRGRSLYLVLLAEAAATSLMRHLGLYRCNLLFSGGGHFLLLAPNSKAAQDTLHQFEHDLNQFLYKTFGGRLGLVLARQETTPGEAFTDLEEVHDQLEARLQQAKRRRAFGLLPSLMAEPGPRETGGSPLADLFITLGERLPKSTHLLETRTYSPELDRAETAVVDFPALGVWYTLGPEAALRRVVQRLGTSTGPLCVHALNNPETFLPERLWTDSLPCGYRFAFYGTHVPVDEKGDAKTFETLAQEDQPQYPLLGFVRMDVDNLGAVFLFGLKGSGQYSLSRLAALSRALTHFFAGHVNTLAQKHEVYIVYAGGDDLFAVGGWRKVLKFSQDVRAALGAFSGGNASVTASAGVAFTKPTLPIYLAADLAGEMEDQAKQQPEKDHVALFGEAVSWKDLTALLDLGQNLYDVLDRSGATIDKKIALPRSFVHRLLELTRACVDPRGNVRIRTVEYTARMLHYAFARRDVGAKDMEEAEASAQSFKATLARYLLTSDRDTLCRHYQTFVIPASYVLLQTRESKQPRS
jgi:CRISPR-associated protein Csm1